MATGEGESEETDCGDSLRARLLQRTYYASGNGQFFFVVPELDLVVLIQAGNYSDGRTRTEFRDRYMREPILPAALALAGE
jgi:hypothetical protein